jgi:hypothetical protein
LWVRETFAVREVKGWTVASSKPDDEDAELLARATHRFKAYRADEWEGDKAPEGMKWRPSIHMPRWASRITLEVVKVRVERLKQISNEDCFAEGLPADTTKGNRTWYADLWESINGKGSWDLDPWVWVVEFKRVEG